MELQQVAFYFKSSFLSQPLLQFSKVTFGKVNNSTTIGADQVVVVLSRSPHQVVLAVTSNVYSTEETKFG